MNDGGGGTTEEQRCNLIVSINALLFSYLLSGTTACASGLDPAVHI